MDTPSKILVEFEQPNDQPRAEGPFATDDRKCEFNLKFPEYKVTVWIDGKKDLASELELFCTLKILLSKEPPHTKITFSTSTMRVGMCVCKRADKKKIRGFFSDSATITITPSHQLPAGWTARADTGPETPNVLNTEVHTTGWHAGGTISVEPDLMMGVKPKAALNAGYSSSTQRTMSSEDFTYHNKCSGQRSEWKRYYTKLDGKDEWKKHFKRTLGIVTEVDKIADLAKTSLPLEAISVYEGPFQTSDKIKWTVCFEPNFRLLRVKSRKGKCYYLKLRMSAEFTTNTNPFDVKING